MPPNENGFVPSFNAMQMQAGVMPGGIPQMMPTAPHPMQVSMALQQQAMMSQYRTPPPSAMFGGTPAMAPGMFGPTLAPPMMGRAAMARQNAVTGSNAIIGGISTGVGVGASILGGMAAGALGGPLGYLAYEGLGVGSAIQRGVGAMFDPIVGMRERGLSLQNSSMQFVVGGPQMSATGQGLSMAASQQAATGIGRLADSTRFRRETHGMFNRADLDRITRLSGELGMLDQAQSADQIIREVKKVSKALSNFMKIAEEPDIQKAMQQMGRLRTFGFSAPEMGTAAQNARTFARMAGVSVDQAFQAGGQGAAMAQSVGQAGATGFDIGVGALGASRQVVANLDPRAVSRLGGAEGIQQTLMGSAMQTQMSDHQLAAALTMRNGRLEVDPNAMRRLNSMSSADVARVGAANMNRFGREGIAQFFSRRNELIDDMAARRSPGEQILAPLLQARQAQRQLGGSLESNLLASGRSTQEVEALMALARNPQALRQQLQRSARERGVARRDEVRSRSGLGSSIGIWADESVLEPLSGAASVIPDAITRHFAEEQDREEALALQGDGPARLIERSRFGSRAQTAAVRDRLRADRRGAYTAAFRASVRAEGRSMVENENAADVDAWGRQGITGRVAGHFYGPDGFGFDRSGRGGETTRSAVLGAADLGTRTLNYFGHGPSARAVEQLGESQESALNAIEERGGTTRERLARRRQATRGVSASSFSAAVSGMRSYVSDQHIGGFVTGSMDRASMNKAVAASMRAQNATEEEIRSVTENDEAMNAVTESFRQGASSSDLRAFETMQEGLRSSMAARAGQTQDQLRSEANKLRDTATDRLGLNDWRDATDPEKQAVLGLISGTGDDTSLRRKILAALLMSRSDDKETARKGTQRLQELQDEPGYDEAFEAVEAVAGRTSGEGTLSRATIEDMAGRLEGQTSEQAESLLDRAGDQATSAGANDLSAANKALLGDRAGRLYQEAVAKGGSAAGVRALRNNAGAIQDAHIKQLVQSGASTQEITEAIDAGTSSRVSTEGGVDAVGAGSTAEDRASMEGTEAMIAAITEGLEDFPGAVNQLSQASQELARTARELRGAASIGELAGMLNAGSGDSPGFGTAVVAGAVNMIPSIGPALSGLIR